jgi:hypothetical protein
MVSMRSSDGTVTRLEAVQFLAMTTDFLNIVYNIRTASEAYLASYLMYGGFFPQELNG